MIWILDFGGKWFGYFPQSVKKIKISFPLKSYVDFSVIYYIKASVVALFSVKPMFSVNLMSVKVMHHCIYQVNANVIRIPQKLTVLL